MNSNTLTTPAGSNDIIKLNVPIPIRTPLSKCILEFSDSHLRLWSISAHSLQKEKHKRNKSDIYIVFKNIKFSKQK